MATLNPTIIRHNHIRIQPLPARENSAPTRRRPVGVLHVSNFLAKSDPAAFFVIFSDPGHLEFSTRSLGLGHAGVLTRSPLRRPFAGHMAMMPTTVSCAAAAEMVQGKHVFDIIDYSKHRGIGHEEHNYIRSVIFSVGGHDWSIRFYPDGVGKGNTDHIVVYLQLMNKRRKVRASCDLRLVNQTTGLSASVHRAEQRMFNPGDSSMFHPRTGLFIKRSEFEGSVYLKDDRLTIECVVTVFREPLVTDRTSGLKIVVSPLDILKDLAKLLETGDGADVEFSVGGQTFAAHRFVLAVRSPVFRAELFGPMKEASAPTVTIQEMQPDVFKALLHFIYTDSLPDMDGLSSGDRGEMLQHLLVAADRYAMDRLNLMCQRMLCEDLDVKNMVATLVLADQHHCVPLKDACIEFIRSSRSHGAVATKGSVDLIWNFMIRYFIYIAIVGGIVGWLCLGHPF